VTKNRKRGQSTPPSNRQPKRPHLPAIPVYSICCVSQLPGVRWLGATSDPDWSSHLAMPSEPHRDHFFPKSRTFIRGFSPVNGSYTIPPPEQTKVETKYSHFLRDTPHSSPPSYLGNSYLPNTLLALHLHQSQPDSASTSYHISSGYSCQGQLPKGVLSES
jgi:hypothetical protein